LINLGLLVYFKYSNFFIDNLNAMSFKVQFGECKSDLELKYEEKEQYKKRKIN